MLEILVGLAVLIGLVGVVLPLLPGLLLAAGAIAVWAVLEQQWWLLAAVAAISAVALILKFAIPARTAKDSASTAALALGAVAGLVGFFVIPVVGMIVGFLLGVLITELVRLQSLPLAWQATWATTKSIGITMAVELVSVIAMTGLWTTALVVG